MIPELDGITRQEHDAPAGRRPCGMTISKTRPETFSSLSSSMLSFHEPVLSTTRTTAFDGSS